MEIKYSKLTEEIIKSKITNMQAFLGQFNLLKEEFILFLRKTPNLLINMGILCQYLLFIFDIGTLHNIYKFFQKYIGVYPSYCFSMIFYALLLPSSFLLLIKIFSLFNAMYDKFINRFIPFKTPLLNKKKKINEFLKQVSNIAKELKQQESVQLFIKDTSKHDITFLLSEDTLEIQCKRNSNYIEKCEVTITEKLKEKIINNYVLDFSYIDDEWNYLINLVDEKN